MDNQHFEDTIRLAQLIGLDYQYDDKKRVVERFAHAWMPWRPFGNAEDSQLVEQWVAAEHPGWQWWGHRYLDDCRLFCQAVLAAFSEEEKDKPYCKAMVQAFDPQADTRGPAIVTHGSITTGFSFHGPFPTVTDAAEWLAGQAVFAGSVVLPTPVDESPALTSAESEVALAELAGRLGEAAAIVRLKEETIVRDIRVTASDRQRFEEELKTLRDRVARRDGYLEFVGWSAKGVREAQGKMAEQAAEIEGLKAECERIRLAAERDKSTMEFSAWHERHKHGHLTRELNDAAITVVRSAWYAEAAKMQAKIAALRDENKRCVDATWRALRDDLNSARREVDELHAQRYRLTADLADLSRGYDGLEGKWIELTDAWARLGTSPSTLKDGVFGMRLHSDETLVQAMHRWYDEFDEVRKGNRVEIKQLQADLAEKQALFDFQWTRTQQAEALWRAAHPGKDDVLPDLGTLIGWLVRSQRLLDRITEGARWCGRVADGVGVNVYLWNLPYCNGRHGTTLLEAAEAGLSEEVSEEVSDD